MKSKTCLGVVSELLKDTGWAIVSDNDNGMYSIIDCGYVKHEMPAQKHAHQVYRSICKILHDHPPDLMAILKGSLDLHSIDSLFGRTYAFL